MAARIGAKEEYTFNSEKLEALKECVKTLNNIPKKIMMLRYQGAVAVKEIASRLGRSESNISIILFRIKKTLKKCIQKKLEGWI